MTRKTLKKARFVVTIAIHKTLDSKNKIQTTSIYDNETKGYFSKEKIQNCGVEWFSDTKDMKETLIFNLDGIMDKYQYVQQGTSETLEIGTAYIF